MKMWLEYSVFKLFSNRKWHGLGPWLMDQRRAWSMEDRPPSPAVELTGACSTSRSRPRRRTGDRTSARKGGGVGAVRAKRRSVGGVGSSPRAGRPFIGWRCGGGGQVPSMASIEAASMLHVEGAGYRRIEEGRGHR
jgi:hypothetical protein